MELVLTKNEIHYIDILDMPVKIRYAVRKRIKKDPRIFFKFYKIAANFNPDIIHVWGNLTALYSIPTKYLMKIPMMNSQVSDAPLRVSNPFLNHKIAFAFSDLIIGNSKAGLKAYQAPVGKSKVIYNSFDFKRISNLKPVSEIKAELQIGTKYVVGMVASFSYYKDYDSYILAALKLVKKNKDISFLAIGDGESSKFNDLVPLQFKKRILFISQQKNVESYMNICDVGVLASFTEGISNALMEFMALEKPVVASGEGGTKELVDNGIDGFLLPARDAELLAYKIEKLLLDDSLRIEMGKKGKEKIKEKFNHSHIMNQYLTNYESLCAE